MRVNHSSSKRDGRKNVRVSKKEKTGGTRIRKRERDMGSLPSLLSLSLSRTDQRNLRGIAWTDDPCGPWRISSVRLSLFERFHHVMASTRWTNARTKGCLRRRLREESLSFRKRNGIRSLRFPVPSSKALRACRFVLERVEKKDTTDLETCI